MQPTRVLLKRSVWKGNYSIPILLPLKSLLPIANLTSFFHRPKPRPVRQNPPLQKKSNVTSCLNSHVHLALFCYSLSIIWPKGPNDKVPPVRTQARSATILPNFVGLKFEIHNGKDYLQVAITEDMVGHKLGEFAP